MKQKTINTKSYVSVPTSEQAIVSDHIDKCKEINTEVKITQHNLPTMYLIPILHNKPYKAPFISNSRSRTTTNTCVQGVPIKTEHLIKWYLSVDVYALSPIGLY